MKRIFLTAVRAVLLIPVFLTAGTAGAQQNTPTPLPEVVVTANRVPTSRANLGSSVTVITEQQIKDSGETELLDLLRQQPGLSVRRNGGSGTTATVSIRGHESYHTLVLVNGIRVADPSGTQPTYDLSRLLVGNIARIEIVRGPQSTNWGGDAVGGVINVVTKEGTGPLSGDARVEYGSHQSRTVSGQIDGQHAKLRFGVGVTSFHTDGISARDRRLGANEADAYDNTTLNGRFGVALDDNLDVSLALRYLTVKADYDAFTRDANYRQDSKEKAGRLAVEHRALNDTLVNQAAISQFSNTRDYVNDPNQTSDYAGGIRKLEYSGRWDGGAWGQMLIGADHERHRAEISNNTYGVTNTGLFLGWQQTWNGALTLDLGGRMDDHQRFGQHRTYRATASYHVDATATRVHSSLGSGFRAPSLYELYAPATASIGPIGNANLRPERTQAWDFGVEQEWLNGDAVLDVTYFRSQSKDLIGFVFGTGYFNVNRARAQGFEVSGRLKLSPEWSLSGNLTTLSTEDRATGTRLSRRPNLEGQAAVHYTPAALSGLRLTLSASGVGDKRDSGTVSRLGGYGVVDMRLSYDITKQLTLSARMENILDKKYQEVSGYGTPGRTVFVGLRASF